MKIIFSDEQLPDTIKKTLFLAGPSIRDYKETDWRKNAISILEELNYDGIVFIPIPSPVFYGKTPLSKNSYDNQIKWEQNARRMSDVILFWIPRNLEKKAYGLTTNFELGEDLNTGKVTYGRPDDADKCKYTDKCVAEKGLPIFKSLNELIKYSLTFLFNVNREKGERFIPSSLWKNHNFTSWLEFNKTSGNHLEDAKVISIFPAILGMDIFSYIIHVNIFVKNENRYKSNEIILSRKDLTSVLPYFKKDGQTYVVLVKEYRSPVRNAENYVYELSGGSGFGVQNAQKELMEETNLNIEESRFQFVNTRQVASTFSVHTNSIYKVELNENEINYILNVAKNNIVFEDEYGCERTFIEVLNVINLFYKPIDYGNIGAILECLNGVK